MGVFNLFKKGFDPDVFEKELTSLTESISIIQEQLFRLHKRKKSINLKLAQYLGLLYLLINIYAYTQIPPEAKGRNKIQKFLQGQTSKQLVFLIVYPIIGYLIIQLISFVFRLFINKKQIYLKKLKKKQNEKIEELKRVTNFNTTNALLKKYGDSEKVPSLVQRKPVQENTAEQKIKNSLNLTPSNTTSTTTRPEKGLNNPPVVRATSPLQSANSAQRTIQDRILDLIIGSDNDESVESRYALICNKCFAHNGLAPPGCKDPLSLKYMCMKCGFLNGRIDQHLDPISTDIKTDVKREYSPTNSTDVKKEVGSEMGKLDPKNIEENKVPEKSSLEAKSKEIESSI